MKANPHILKIRGGKYGLIAFNNMILVMDSELVSFNFNDEKRNYRNLLTSQFIFCDNNKEHIAQKAETTYSKVTIEKELGNLNKQNLPYTFR